MKDLDLEFDFSEDRERFSELSHLKKATGSGWSS